MESLGGLNVEKLNDTNFHIWKQKFNFVFEFLELDSVVIMSGHTSNKDKHWDQIRRETEAKGIIGFALSDEHLDHLLGVCSSSDM